MGNANPQPPKWERPAPMDYKIMRSDEAIRADLRAQLKDVYKRYHQRWCGHSIGA
jgi:hypothetical protein